MRARFRFALVIAVLVPGLLWGEGGMNRPPAELEPIGIFDDRTDVGTIDRPGSVDYDSTTQVYLIEGSGNNMWSDHDDFYVVWKRLRGDFIVRS